MARKVGRHKGKGRGKRGGRLGGQIGPVRSKGKMSNRKIISANRGR